MENDSRAREKQVYIIDILRFAACLMIFFYHCNSLLPGEFKFLTFFGEDMGNDLFFMISGFALYPSIERTPLSALPAWYLRRLKRILPMLAFFYILSFLTGYYSFKNAFQLFTVFIYPTLYWFATAILFFYLLLFVVMKVRPKLIRWLVAAALMPIWIMRIDKMEGYYLIGFIAMMAGCYLREFLDRRKRMEADMPGIRKLWVGFVAFGIVYIISKYYKFTGHISTSIYFIVGMSVLTAGIFALTLGYVGNEALKGFFEGRKELARFIRYVGGLALPVYLVQSFNSGVIGFTIGQRVKFPLSFAVNFIIIWGAAIAVERLQAFVMKRGSSGRQQ